MQRGSSPGSKMDMLLQTSVFVCIRVLMYVCVYACIYATVCMYVGTYVIGHWCHALASKSCPKSNAKNESKIPKK